ncbi:MAG: metalloregulator ArsR/SmtB family transcription factor [Bacillota bacterium]
MKTVDYRVSEVFRAMSHPTRIAILDMLKGGPLCVCQIYPALGLDQSITSKHLGVLRSQGIIRGRKEGLKVTYEITDERYLQVLEAVKEILKRQWYLEGKMWNDSGKDR